MDSGERAEEEQVVEQEPELSHEELRAQLEALKAEMQERKEATEK